MEQEMLELASTRKNFPVKTNKNSSNLALQRMHVKVVK